MFNLSFLWRLDGKYRSATAPIVYCSLLSYRVSTDEQSNHLWALVFTHPGVAGSLFIFYAVLEQTIESKAIFETVFDLLANLAGYLCCITQILTAGWFQNANMVILCD